MAKRERLLQDIRGVVAREREAEIEYGLKEFIQGLLVGFIIGFLIATQLL
jgi:F0F1-type ATP synthase assembly protein I